MQRVLFVSMRRVSRDEILTFTSAVYYTNTLADVHTCIHTYMLACIYILYIRI